MSNSKPRTEIERLVESLDDVAVSNADAQETVKRLGINTLAWAADVRSRVAASEATRRKARFEEAREAYAADLERLTRRKHESVRPLDVQRQRVRALIARIPQEAGVSMHFHKFEQATAEELAEMIKSLSHLLGEDADDDED